MKGMLLPGRNTEPLKDDLAKRLDWPLAEATILVYTTIYTVGGRVHYVEHHARTDGRGGRATARRLRTTGHDHHGHIRRRHLHLHRRGRLLLQRADPAQ